MSREVTAAERKATKMLELWGAEKLAEVQEYQVQFENDYFPGRNIADIEAPINVDTVTVEFIHNEGYVYSAYTADPGSTAVEIHGRNTKGHSFACYIDPEDFNFSEVLTRMVELSENGMGS